MDENNEMMEINEVETEETEGSGYGALAILCGISACIGAGALAAGQKIVKKHKAKKAAKAEAVEAEKVGIIQKLKDKRKAKKDEPVIVIDQTEG